MIFQYNWFVFALMLNAVLLGALFTYTWNLKETVGSKYFAFALLACLLWDLASIFELSSTLLNTKIFFEKIVYFGAASVANFWFFFAITISQKYKIKKIHLLFWIIPVTTLILAWTNDFHKLIWTDVYLSNSPYGIVAIYKHGALFFLNVVYSYILLTIGALLLIKEAIDFPKSYRKNGLILIIAVCMPRFSDVLYVIGLGPVKGLDPGLFFFTISASLIVFGFLKLKLLNITPIAQEIIFSSIVEGIIVTDVHNSLIEVNQSAMKIFNNGVKLGENIEGVLIKHFPDLSIDLLDKAQEVFTKVTKKIVWYEFKISQIKNLGGDLLGKIFIFRDVTERKINEEILKESEKHLLELNEIKNRFFSILSHDLRSPFSGLIGFVEILKDDFESLPLKEKESFINEIDLTTKNIYEFLEDLLEWSRLNMGSFKAQIGTLKLYDEVEEVFSLLTYNARRKGISLVNELNKQDYACGDASMVKLLLRNLISNAIKFTEKDGIIRVYSRTNNSGVEVSVADNGLGISPDAIQKLFRLDVKYTTTGTADERGSGIGLVLCKEIVEKLNGKIKVESELGKGSTFTFLLPVNIE
jgi:signal transduction histidine kinase